MNIIFCDDDLTLVKQVRKIAVEKYKDEHCFYCFSGYLQACAFLKDCTERIDLLITDIELGDGTGLNLAAEVAHVNSDLCVIYITGHSGEYCEKIFDGIKPFSYLKKPVSFDKLTGSIAEAEIYLKTYTKSISLKVPGGQIPVNLSKVILFETYKRALRVIFTDGDLTVSENIDDIQTLLPDAFIRCHKSVIVNAAYIRTVNKNLFVLKDGKEIGISRTYLKSAKDKYYCLLGR